MKRLHKNMNGTVVVRRGTIFNRRYLNLNFPLQWLKKSDSRYKTDCVTTDEGKASLALLDNMYMPWWVIYEEYLDMSPNPHRVENDLS